MMDAVVVVLQGTGLAEIAMTRPALGIRRIFGTPAIRRSAATVIDRNRIPHWSAEQFPDRLLRQLTENVPQSQVDCRDRPQLAALYAKGGSTFVQEPPVALNRRRISA